MTITKPMLAVSVENIEQIEYPVYVSPKLDGIRCLINNSIPLSRSFKPIPNKYIQKELPKYVKNGLDGELMINGATFNEIQSFVMSEDKEITFEYHIFDYINSSLQQPFHERLKNLKEIPENCVIKRVQQVLINSTKELLEYEEKCVSLGYEGIMVRSLNSPYKCGRSTLKEGYLLKIKRFKDDEAIIIGFNERMHNNNEAFKDELGHTKRSTHRENKVPTNTLGSFVLKLQSGLTFEIGTGFTDNQRQEYWNNRESLINQLVKFKYQELSKDGIPRFPVFLGFRNKLDI